MNLVLIHGFLEDLGLDSTRFTRCLCFDVELLKSLGDCCFQWAGILLDQDLVLRLDVPSEIRSDGTPVGAFRWAMDAVQNTVTAREFGLARFCWAGVFPRRLCCTTLGPRRR